MTTRGPVITCECGCGRTGPHSARGLVATCYKRATRRGQVTDYPPRTIDPTRRQELAAALRAAHTRRRIARMEDYVDLREWGETRQAAADRIGVTRRTTQRWHATLRAQGAAYSWLPPVPDHLTPATYPKTGAAA